MFGMVKKNIVEVYNYGKSTPPTAGNRWWIRTAANQVKYGNAIVLNSFG